MAKALTLKNVGGNALLRRVGPLPPRSWPSQLTYLRLAGGEAFQPLTGWLSSACSS